MYAIRSYYGQLGPNLALTVENKPEREQPQLRELGDDGEVVAHPAVRPTHPIHAVADQRIEPGCGHRAEPGCGTVGTPDQPEVDGLGMTSYNFV